MPREPGRAGQEPSTRIGIFVRDYLRDVGQASISDIHRAYKTHLGWLSSQRERAATLDRQSRGLPLSHSPKLHRYRAATYKSFGVTFWLFKRAGFVVDTGIREDQRDPRHASLKSKRSIYQLSGRGDRASDEAWLHPSDLEPVRRLPRPRRLPERPPTERPSEAVGPPRARRRPPAITSETVRAEALAITEPLLARLLEQFEGTNEEKMGMLETATQMRDRLGQLWFRMSKVRAERVQEEIRPVLSRIDELLDRLRPLVELLLPSWQVWQEKGEEREAGRTWQVITEEIESLREQIGGLSGVRG